MKVRAATHNKMFEHEEYGDGCKISTYHYDRLTNNMIFLGAIVARCKGEAVHFEAREIEATKKFELLFIVKQEGIKQDFIYYLPNLDISDFKVSDFIILKQATKPNDKAVYRIEGTPNG